MCKFLDVTYIKEMRNGIRVVGYLLVVRLVISHHGRAVAIISFPLTIVNVKLSATYPK